MRRLRAVRRQMEARKGATLVLVAMLLVVLTGFVGVGVDFARAYAFKTQLKTVTDASAMAGAIEMVQGNTASDAPQTAALGYVPLNTIEGIQTAYSADSNVDAVAWDFTKRGIDSSKGVNGSLDDAYDNPEANAIRVAARYTMSTTFGRIFGVTNWTLVDTTIAALGGVGDQECLQPWAVKYQRIVDLLNEKFPPATRAVSDPLTQADITNLTNLGAGGEITLLNDNNTQNTAGNILQVKTWTPDWEPPSGKGKYQAAIAGPDCANLTIGPGSWLETDPGAGEGQTKSAIDDLCKNQGGTASKSNGTDSIGKYTDYECSVDPGVKLAMWNCINSDPTCGYPGGTGDTGANAKYRVNEIAVFKVSKMRLYTGKDGTYQVSGYFSSMPAEGGFAGGAGMVFKGAIVY